MVSRTMIVTYAFDVRASDGLACMNHMVARMRVSVRHSRESFSVVYYVSAFPELALLSVGTAAVDNQAAAAADIFP